MGDACRYNGEVCVIGPWFSGEAFRPGRIGMYECILGGYGETIMLFWDGIRWLQDPALGRAVDGPVLSTFGVYLGDMWRGIMK